MKKDWISKLFIFLFGVDYSNTDLEFKNGMPQVTERGMRKRLREYYGPDADVKFIYDEEEQSKTNSH